MIIDWKKSFDWKAVILNLHHSGLHSTAVEKKTGIPCYKIREIVALKAHFTMSFEEANKLMDLHFDHCRDRHTQELINHE